MSQKITKGTEVIVVFLDEIFKSRSGLFTVERIVNKNTCLITSKNTGNIILDIRENGKNFSIQTVAAIDARRV